MLNHNEIFLRAWKNVLEGYRNGKIRFISEADLQSHLFSECLRLMETEKFETPYKIHANKSLFTPRRKTDLVLGHDEVAIEIKLEPDYPGVSKPVVFREEVEKDIAKLDEYLRQRVKHAHFVMIDEDGNHMRNPRIHEEWKTIRVGDKEVFYLLVSRK